MVLEVGEGLCARVQDDCDDDTVNSDGLTEDDTDQILGLNTRHLDG